MATSLLLLKSQQEGTERPYEEGRDISEKVFEGRGRIYRNGDVFSFSGF